MSPAKPHLPNAVLATLIFIATEVMLFAALISAYMIVRAGVGDWPPAGQPRLPVAATAVNTALLLLSGLLMFVTYRHFKRSGNRKITAQLFFLTVICGASFLVLQGREWVELLRYGLGLTSSVYGAFFYLIIGTHGLHVLAALIFIVIMFGRFMHGRLVKENFQATQIFWFFVVGIWPVLYVLVYLV